MEDGPPMFRQDVSCPALLEDHGKDVAYGAVTHHAELSNSFRCHIPWPLAWSAFARHY